MNTTIRHRTGYRIPVERQVNDSEFAARVAARGIHLWMLQDYCRTLPAPEYTGETSYLVRLADRADLGGFHPGDRQELWILAAAACLPLPPSWSDVEPYTEADIRRARFILDQELSETVYGPKPSRN